MSMNRLPKCVDYKEVVRAFASLGWRKLPSGRGKHVKLSNGKAPVSIPKEHLKVLQAAAIMGYLKVVGVSKEDFLQALYK